jgi:hypothetical protein
MKLMEELGGKTLPAAKPLPAAPVKPIDPLA